MKDNIKSDSEIIEYLVLLLDGGAGSSGLFERHPQPDSMEMDIARYLKKFVDRMPGGFFIYHADGNEEIIYANAAMIRLFECESMEEFRMLTGNSFRGIVHPDDLEFVEQSIKEQIAASCYDLDYVEYRIISKTGQIRWIDDYGHFVHSELVGDVFYVFVGDATEKKLRQFEEMSTLLKENSRKEHLLQTRIQEYNQELQIIHQEQLKHLELIEGLSIDYDSIFYADLDANKIKAYCVSDRIKDQFPQEYQVRTFDGFDAQYIKAWVHPDDRELMAKATRPEYIRARLREDKAFYINYRICRNTKLAYMQLHMVDVSGDARGSQVVLGYRNIDKEVEKGLSQKQLLVNALQEAQLANSAKDLFLSNMSHDIRTPMNAIVGFTALARQHIDDRQKVAEYLDMIAAASDQLLQLLNDVLEISKIESEQVHVEEGACKLIEIARQVQDSVFQRAAEKNICLSMDIAELRHDDVIADRQKLLQIMTHLMGNALKYTEENGQVTITIAELDGQKEDHTIYRLVVEDTGIGMSRAFIEHMFEPFEREKNTTLSGIHGTGLGLTIVKKLVDMMGGTVSVDSEVGKGSRFTVSLPLQIQRVKREALALEKGVGDSFISEPKRILLVDDNEINLEIEKEMLSDAGFLVETASDGSIAYEKIRQAKAGEFDLILMDIQMPVMDGYKATRAIRALKDSALSGIPIIAVSANTFEEDRKKALESGMNAHLPKPLNMGELLEQIGELL